MNKNVVYLLKKLGILILYYMILKKLFLLQTVFIKITYGYFVTSFFLIKYRLLKSRIAGFLK